jgi:hypothetical protein
MKSTLFMALLAFSGAAASTGIFTCPKFFPQNITNGRKHIVSCRDSLKTAYLLAPEINLKANSGGLGNIPNGSTVTNGLNNTAFGDINLGSAATKDFRIENLGTAPLLLAGLPIIAISGVNAADFTVTTFPSVTTIAAGVHKSFVVTFSPQASGYRMALVSIATNDADENPYTFKIDGNGICLGTANALSPVSGPAGTGIEITATANNLDGATAKLNGVPMSVEQLSPTQIKVIVPAGANSGSIITTNSQGCSAANYFSVYNNAIASCQGSSGTPRTKLFISEITDHGTGSHSFVEIFNATGAVVNLSGYSIRLHNNGSATATATIPLSNYNLANNAAYILAFGGADATSNPGGIIPNQTSSASGINDNDNIRLYDNSGTWIDLWGNISGSVFTVAPKDYVYRRKKMGIVAPSSTWNAADWIAFSPVNYSDVGQYDFSIGIAPLISAQPIFDPTCNTGGITIIGTEGFSGGNALSYQWFKIDANETNWTAITDDSLFSGTSTPTIAISDISGLTDSQFYCRVLEDTAGCYTATNVVSVGNGSTVTWNGNWTPLPGPGPLSEVVVQANYDTALNGSFEACSLRLLGGNTLTIGDSGYVSIENNLVVDPAATLEVLNNGSLIMKADDGIITNNGTMKVSRTTTPFALYDYTYWSSPMTASLLSDAFFDWRTDHAYTLTVANYSDITGPDGTGAADDNDDNGDAWTAAGLAAMQPGIGYAIMGSTSATSYPITSTVTFTGTVNNGEIVVPLGLSENTADDTDDYNLVGNPYPSALAADDFINANPDSSGTLYFWTHSTQTPYGYYYISADYSMYNLSGGIAAIPDAGAIPTGLIASGQGFLVEANSAGSIVFNNSMRNKSYPNADFFRISADDAPQKDRIWLDLTTSTGRFSQQLIAYLPEATDQIDWGYDGRTNEAGNDISFYSLIDGDKFRIQGKQPFVDVDVVPLGYFTNQPQTLTIAIHQTQGILSDPDVPIYLEDKSFQTFSALKLSSYDFMSEAGTFDERFVLHYMLADQLPITDFNPGGDFIVAVNQGEIFMASPKEKIVAVVLYDMVGRKIYDMQTVNSFDYSIDYSTSNRKALIVKTTFENGRVVTRKIVI